MQKTVQRVKLLQARILLATQKQNN
jgi:hypothetical protein